MKKSREFVFVNSDEAATPHTSARVYNDKLDHGIKTAAGVLDLGIYEMWGLNCKTWKLGPGVWKVYNGSEKFVGYVIERAWCE